MLLGLALVLLSTRFYPGGTTEHSTAVGFDWSRNYLTHLFRPVALNGEPNAARPYAIAGMWLFCAGMAELFRQLAKTMAPDRQAKWLHICGIAAMVYAALTVTRMHDLMVTLALIFFVAAEMLLLHWLWQRRRFRPWVAGAASLALLIAASLIYYTQMAIAVLPAMQKLVFLSSVCWLFWVHSPGPDAGLPPRVVTPANFS